MKAISLWQPWASLMALGWKKNETRPWLTRYRGPLLIHAAKKIVPWPSIMIQAVFEDIAFQPPDLPLGAILCKVSLVDCVKITFYNRPSYPEVKYGDYTSGRYQWITEDLEIFDSPIPFRGRQGIFNVPEKIILEATKDKIICQNYPLSQKT